HPPSVPTRRSSDQVALGIKAEFELGICQNNALGFCNLGGCGVNPQGLIAKLLCSLLSQVLHHALESDIFFVVSLLRFGRWGNNWLGQPRCVHETIGKLNAT